MKISNLINIERFIKKIKNFILKIIKLHTEKQKVKQLLIAVPKFTQVRLELSNACGYQCVCCPREKMTRKIGFMSDEDLRIIAKNIPYADEIEEVHMQGYGEPLLTKDLIHKAKLVRSFFSNALIQILSTLGYDISDEYMEELVNSEINQLSVSFYGGNRENYKKMHGIDTFDLAYRNLKKIIEINQKNNNKLDILFHYSNYNEIPNSNIKLPSNDILMKNLCVELKELGLSEEKMYSFKLHNYGSGRNYAEINEKKPCSIAYGAYKKYLQISWNLNVIPCSSTYNDEIILGNLKRENIEDIFSKKKYKKFIMDHLDNKLNDYLPCKNCQREFSATLEENEMWMKYKRKK